jgi:tetratricopeptide (TPR) repeat protein
MIYAVVLHLAFHATVRGLVQSGEAGTVAVREGQTDVGVTQLRKAIDLAPDQAAGYFNLGVAYSLRRDYGEAVPLLRKAIELDPRLAAAHQYLGYALLAQGYAAESIAEFKGVNDQAGLGIAQLEIGDLPQAVQNLQAALVGRSNDPDLLYYLARASGLLSKQTYDLLISTYPSSARANEALAENYSALRHVQEAETSYLAALRLRPDLPGAHLALGQVYASAEKWNQAQDQFSAEVKLRPGSAEAEYRLGFSLLQNGREHEALVALKRADILQPDMPETLYALGKAEFMAGDYPAAEKDWNRVLALESTGPLASQVHFGLATLYRKQGRNEDAKRQMKLFEESRSTTPQ